MSGADVDDASSRPGPAAPAARRRGRRRSRPRGPDEGRDPQQGRGSDEGRPTRGQPHDQRHRQGARRESPASRQAHRERVAAVRQAVVLPPVTYPEQLPVSARRDEIAAAIRDHQVVVVSGETGSGKTTQLPKILLELGRGRAGQIGHTQPRRIAARSVAERIAEELGVPLGGVVGYQVRFTDNSSDATLVKVMTDGILLAAIQRDPMLLAYDTIVVDEAHERSLNIDFLLGYLARLLPQRPDLKLVVTSATIDSARFAEHFGTDGVPAPVVEVQGRTFPVEVRYRPLSPDRRDDDEADATPGAPGPTKSRGKTPKAEEKDLLTGIVEAVDELMHEGPGDILVFLSGEREIRDAEDALRGFLGPRVSDPRHPQAVELLPLYSRLSAAEQHRVFEPHSARRVVLSTNVAETSLTVPGIHYVVDPGTARITRYSQATKVQRLPIEPISQASANQRSGRCGRLADGVAIRLYSRDDFEARPRFTEPEILRTSLASVILQMVAVGVVSAPDEVVTFPFVDPPDTRAVRDGVALLHELGALARSSDTGAWHLTDVGRRLAALPIDPRLARMVVEADRLGVAREVVVLVAALSIQDPRERPAEQREQADALHRRFVDPSSDLLTYLNLWTWLREQRRELSGSAYRRLVRSQHLNYLRLREWQDVVTQLRDLVGGPEVKGAPRPAADPAPDERPARRGPSGAAVSAASDEPTPPAPDDERTTWSWDGDTIHRAVLPGLLSQIGMQEATEVSTRTQPKGRPDRRGRNEYLGARGARFALWPGSGLARRPPAWVMAAELVETSRLWARDAARIRPEWAEEAAAHLVRRSYANPGWSPRQGAATVTERVLLYGIPLVADRRVLLAKVDPSQARELFLRHALVQGEWATHHAFFHENRRLLAEAEALEARARRRDLVVDDDVLFDFYDERVPDSVVSSRHFDRWWKDARREHPDLLTFTRDLLVAGDAAVDEGAFPAHWPAGDLSLPLTYQFEPGTAADGVTAHVTLAALPRLRPEGFDWMVPGLRAELVTATIRTLPKPVRVQLVPAPDVARAVDAWMSEHLASWADTVRAGDAAPSFHRAFAQAVLALRGVSVPDDAFDDDRLPPHLRMTFRVVDTSGDPVGEGKDLLALQRRLAGRAQDAVSSAVRTAVQAALEEARAAASPAVGPGSADPSASPGSAPRAGAASRTPERGSSVLGAVGLSTALSTELPRSPGGPGGRAPGPGPGASGPGSRGECGGNAPSAGGVSPALGQFPPHSASGAGVVVERTGLTTWPDDLVLPAVVVAGAVRAYPALVDEGGSVAVRALADEAAAPARHRRGLARLLLLDVGLGTARVTTRWTGTQALALAASPYPSTSALVSDVQLAAIEHLLPDEEVRDPQAYQRLRAQVRDALEDEVHRLVGTLVDVLSAWRELDADLRAARSLALLGTARDIRAQADALVGPGFVAATGAARLPNLARYLRAARYRLDKAAQNPGRDESLAHQVRQAQQEYDEAAARVRAQAPDAARLAALEEVGWQLQELRVSLFAQHLGTPAPVSTARIHKALVALG